MASQRVLSLLSDHQQPVLKLEILLSILTAFFFIFFIHLLLRVFGRTQAAPVNWPVIGMLPGLMANRHRFLDYCTSILRESGGTVEFKGPWFAGMNFIVTCDPANANHIFNTHFAGYPKGHDFREIFDFLGDGIFNVDDDLWRYQRRTAHAKLNSLQFQSVVEKWSREKVASAVLPLLETMEVSGTTVNLQDVFSRFVFDINCRLVLGVDPCSLAPDFPVLPFSVAVDTAQEISFLRHFVPMFWWKFKRALGIGTEKRLAMANEVIDQFIAQCIVKRREGQGDQTSPAILSLYMDSDYLDDLSHLETGVIEYFRSDKFVRDSLLTFLIAGVDSTAAALSWFYHLLLKNPNTEKKIVQELYEVCPSLLEGQPPSWTVFDAEKIERLVYLHAALCETMRLFPPIPLNHKSSLMEDVLPSGHKVQPNTSIFYSIYSAGRMKKVWGDDCLEFKPERWISDDGKQKTEPSYKFLVFHCGPRTCLGKAMAFTEMKIIAATLIYNFHIQATEDHVAEHKLSIALQMKNGLKVKVKKRENTAS